MTRKLKLKIVTPEEQILEEEVESVNIPTTEGEITVLPRHIPIVARLASGNVIAKEGGEYIPLAVVGGFVEVKTEKQENGEVRTEVIVLADFAEHVSKISDEEIEKAKQKAEEIKQLLANKEGVDFEHFETELERSLTRVKIADKWRLRKYRK